MSKEQQAEQEARQAERDAFRLWVAASDIANLMYQRLLAVRNASEAAELGQQEQPK